MRKRWIAMACALSVGLAGCRNTELASEQLARVAKDWSLTIRASQVIPVYPLTEDLQPGDIFLVDFPIQNQVAIYESKGFLPLENLIARLDIDGKDYKIFYKGWPGIDSSPASTPPRLWQFPPKDLKEAGFEYTPLVKFPSYEFTVSRSGGLGLALPISGVPIGLNLLDSGSASGTITMKDAYTYGLPVTVLSEKVREWSDSESAKNYLTPFHANEQRQYYVRVVDRVYLVKEMTVSLFDNRSSGGAVDAGVPQSIILPPVCKNTSDPTLCFEKINTIISPEGSSSSSSRASPADASGLLVGGSLKVSMASGRGITLNETFARPVVVGYQAFDYPILDNGTLGAPVGTLAKLEQREQFKPSDSVCIFGSDDNIKKIRKWRKENADNQDELNKWREKNKILDPFALYNCSEFANQRQQAVSFFKIP